MSTTCEKEKIDILVNDTVWPRSAKPASWRRAIGRRTTVHVHKGWMPRSLPRSSSVFLVSNTTGISSVMDAWTLHEIPATRKRFLLWVDDEPDGLAEVLPRLNVRSDDRLHLVRSEREPDFSKLLVRLVLVLNKGMGSESIFDAFWKDETFVVVSPLFQRLHVPMNQISKVCNASQADRECFEIDQHGDFVFWPNLDVHMGWSQFLQAVDPLAKLRAEQRSEAFNKAYGAAIRQLREEAGLRQSDIGDLDERTVRRIEDGETRATANAIEALAKAHRMTPNQYMQRLAALLGESS